MMIRNSQKAAPERFSLGGKPVHCPHCGGNEFIAGKAQLNTAFATLINLDWIDRTAVILSCTSCGQIQWFEGEPTRDA